MIVLADWIGSDDWVERSYHLWEVPIGLTCKRVCKNPYPYSQVSLYWNYKHKRRRFVQQLLGIAPADTTRPALPSPDPDRDNAFLRNLERKITKFDDMGIAEMEVIRSKDPDSNCVPVFRSLEEWQNQSDLDGLLHLTCYRIWRDPSIRCHHRELCSTGSCPNGYLRRAICFCINPYHYEPATAPVLFPILVPQNSVKTQLLGVEPVCFEDTDYWCSVRYHELSAPIGTPFHAVQPWLIIDGSLGPFDFERFSLGSIVNSRRDPEVERTRAHIDKNLRLSYVGGDVFVECLMPEYALFVQSATGNQIQGCSRDTVWRVCPGCIMKIFSNKEYAEMLSQAVAAGLDAVMALRDKYGIRISFVKGWGESYRRRTILSTPCWIEVRMNGPIQWPERVLAVMRHGTRRYT